ncbi:MAG: hypothetical protein EKK47_13925 [Burkholderiales bacterium]|nr:MAG: hypothetical protein EKK47_13925 [Burkholderiales bacterium]
MGQRTWNALAALAVLMGPLASSADDLKHLYLCRSPLLAFDFWETLQQLHQKGITITPTIASEVCAGMKAGADPQCIRVEAAKFDVVATGYGGAMAMTDGTTKTWFHNPESAGWVHPQYYVQSLKAK